MAWRNIIVEDGEHLKVYLDNIEIYKNEEKYVMPINGFSILAI